jgi:hypothetical protein
MSESDSQDNILSQSGGSGGGTRSSPRQPSRQSNLPSLPIHPALQHGVQLPTSIQAGSSVGNTVTVDPLSSQLERPPSSTPSLGGSMPQRYCKTYLITLFPVYIKAHLEPHSMVYRFLLVSFLIAWRQSRDPQIGHCSRYRLWNNIDKDILITAI